MPRMKFTDRAIAAIKPPESGQVDYWDESLPGFGLRVSYGGRKAWVLMYRHGRTQRRLSLGTYPVRGYGKAKDEAIKALGKLSDDVDPAAEKIAARKAETVKELCTLYIERYAKRRKKSWRRDESILKRDVRPAIGSFRAIDVRRKDINKIIDDIVQRGAPILANRTLEVIRKMFNWAISQDIVQNNPCQGIPKPSAEHQRDRVLNDDEIRAVWSELGKAKSLVALSFKLRLLTLQRGAEVLSMRKSDIDGKWWTIPGEFTKNGLAHRVPLNGAALQLVGGLLKRNAGVQQKQKRDTEWLFENEKTGKPYSAVVKTHRAIVEASGVNFVPHDYRRTGASRMTSMGIRRLTVSKILNHVESGVTAVYDRHSYDAEKGQALNAWDAKLREILANEPSTEKVVSLADRR